MNKKKVYIAIGIIFILLMFWLFNGTDKDEIKEIIVPVKKGKFNVEVTTSGELFAKNSEDITVPIFLLRSLGIWNIKITDIVLEGKVVKKDDYVATLDKSEIMGKVKDKETELLKIESKYIQTKLDTTLELRNARDELQNLKYAIEEKKIAVEQSTFEPPATIRQVNIEYDKAVRAYDQAIENYKIKKDLSNAKMQEVSASFEQEKRNYEKFLELVNNLEIKAPKDGMVIYIREWDGRKKVVGSTVSPWEPAVATLPDLAQMISKTYVNEVDIRKVKVGQITKIGLDAFPEKLLTGIVESVANVGEQRPNSDSKVFEVNVLIKGIDTTLRPAMTTSNIILTSYSEDVLFLPLECVHKDDSISYVYKVKLFGAVKKEVKVGIANDNEIIIHEGLDENDKIYMSTPQETNDLDFIRLKDE